MIGPTEQLLQDFQICHKHLSELAARGGIDLHQNLEAQRTALRPRLITAEQTLTHILIQQQPLRRKLIKQLGQYYENPPEALDRLCAVIQADPNNLATILTDSFDQPARLGTLIGNPTVPFNVSKRFKSSWLTRDRKWQGKIYQSFGALTPWLVEEALTRKNLEQLQQHYSTVSALIPWRDRFVQLGAQLLESPAPRMDATFTQRALYQRFQAIRTQNTQ